MTFVLCSLISKTMSKFAKAQMEKWGWKEGEGIGKEKQGVTSYVRAARSGNTGEVRGEAFGLGHEKAAGAQPKALGVDDMGYGATLKSIRSKSPGKKTRSDTDGVEEEDTKVVSPKSFPLRKKNKKEVTVSSSSSSDTENEDPTKWSDEKLFAKCGGVRLGRTGRARLFDGKLARADAHADLNRSKDPYKRKEK